MSSQNPSSSSSSTPSLKADYGIDAPEVIRTMFLIGAGLVTAGSLVPTSQIGRTKVSFLKPLLIALGVPPIALGSALTAYGLRGKFGLRDQMLNTIPWKGDETVLDVGTGRGLMMIGAAKRLTTGKSIGIDIWRTGDLSGNNVENTLRNARIEGVADKIEIKNEDVRTMSFPDNSFDVILSVLCVHNIEGADEREKACREIARVLKPGGTVLLSDYTNVPDYAKALAAAGLTVQSVRFSVPIIYGLMWTVQATKN